MRATLVQNRAFTEVKEISIEGAEYNHYIRELYKSERPNYLEADNEIEIDLDSKETEQVREVFNNQLDALKSGYNQLIIDRLSQEGDVNAWLNIFDTTFDHLKDPSFYGKTPKFHVGCKRALEQILFTLESNSDLRSLKKNIAYVAQQLQVCGLEIFTTLMDVEYQLINNSVKPDLLTWLADLRKNILYQIAEDHIHKHRISEAYSIHVHFRFSQMAKEAGWVVPQILKFEGLSDILSDGMVSIDDTTLPWLKAEFIKRYNHQAMTKQVREVFNNQLDALKSGYNQLIIDRLSQEGDGNINALLDVLNTTFDHLKDPSFYGKTPKFYVGCKRALEQILFALESNSDLRSLKKNIAYVAQQLQVCGPGIFTTLMDVEYQLINNSAKPDLLKWLADLRRNILYQIAEEHIHKHRISGGHSIHVHFRFNQMAKEAGWAVPQTKKFEGLSDILSDGIVSIDDTTQPWLKAEFIKRYNHQAMIDTLVVRFSDIISKFLASSYDLYNLDTFKSFEVLVKPFIDNKVCKNVYDFLECDDNEGKYRIKADFAAQLPQYCEALLVAEDFIDNPQKIIKAQAYSRGFLARREYQKQRDAATTIQTAYRGFWARNKYKAMKLEQEIEQILKAHQEIVAGWGARNVITVDQLMRCKQPENLRILLSRPFIVEDLLKTNDGASIHQLLQMDSNSLETLIYKMVGWIFHQQRYLLPGLPKCHTVRKRGPYLTKNSTVRKPLETPPPIGYVDMGVRHSPSGFK